MILACSNNNCSAGFLYTPICWFQSFGLYSQIICLLARYQSDLEGEDAVKVAERFYLEAAMINPDIGNDNFFPIFSLFFM